MIGQCTYYYRKGGKRGSRCPRKPRLSEPRVSEEVLCYEHKPRVILRARRRRVPPAWEPNGIGKSGEEQEEQVALDRDPDVVGKSGEEQVALDRPKDILMFTLDNDPAISPQNDLLGYIKKECPSVVVHSLHFTQQKEIEAKLQEFKHSVCMLVINTHSDKSTIQTGSSEWPRVTDKGEMSKEMETLLRAIKQATTPKCKVILASCSAAANIGMMRDVELERPTFKGNDHVPWDCDNMRGYALIHYRFAVSLSPGTAELFARELPGRRIYATACKQVQDELTIATYPAAAPEGMCGEGTAELNVAVVSHRQCMYVAEFDPTEQEVSFSIASWF